MQVLVFQNVGYFLRLPSQGLLLFLSLPATLSLTELYSASQPISMQLSIHFKTQVKSVHHTTDKNNKRQKSYLFVIENLPQIIVQHVCPVVVSLQQTSKLIKIGGIHKNTLQFGNSLSFGLIPKDYLGDTV